MEFTTSPQSREIIESLKQLAVEVVHWHYVQQSWVMRSSIYQQLVYYHVCIMDNSTSNSFLVAPSLAVASPLATVPGISIRCCILIVSQSVAASSLQLWLCKWLVFLSSVHRIKSIWNYPQLLRIQVPKPFWSPCNFPSRTIFADTLLTFESSNLFRISKLGNFLQTEVRSTPL